jgi:hypothetical protein
MAMSEEAAKKTLGEELFLVHLSRQVDVTADDVDHELRKEREHKLTIGDELWQVHCKRAANKTDEEDGSLEAPVSPTTTKKHVKTNVSGTHHTPTATFDDKIVHHLRNRDIVLA